MVEHWDSVVPPLYRYITYPSRFSMSLTIFGVSKSDFQRDQKKIPLLVRTFRSELSTGFGKVFEKPLIYLQKKLSNSHPVWKFSFQVVAGEKGVLSTTSPQMVASENEFLCVLHLQSSKTLPQVVACGIGRLGSVLRKNLSPNGSRRERHF